MKRLTPSQINKYFIGHSGFNCQYSPDYRTIVITPKNGKRIAGLDVPFLMDIAADRVSYFRATLDGTIEFVIEY